MEYTFAQYQESAQALRDRLGAFRPRCLLILGSGLGSLGNEVESPIAVPYEDVPHMKRSTAPDHAGRFVFGRLAGQDVAVMQGRLHTYEGWSFEDVSYPVRVLRLLGAETLVVTNAAGAVNTAFSAGDIMLITDHIKLFGVSPLCGPNLEEFGPRFPDMSHVYTPRLQDTAREAAEELSIPLRQGVYMYFPGPQYETPAEVRAARALGADAVVRREAPSLGVESFGYFQKDTPGVYYDLGSGVGTALHTGTFVVNEACLLPGVALQCATALMLLGTTKGGNEE